MPQNLSISQYHSSFCVSCDSKSICTLWPRLPSIALAYEVPIVYAHSTVTYTHTHTHTLHLNASFVADVVCFQIQSSVLFLKHIFQANAKLWESFFAWTECFIFTFIIRITFANKRKKFVFFFRQNFLHAAWIPHAFPWTMCSLSRKALLIFSRWSLERVSQWANGKRMSVWERGGGEKNIMLKFRSKENGNAIVKM